MKIRVLGIVLAAVGAVMIVYTGFNFITKENVVDLGPIEIKKEVTHPVQWSPIVGVVLLAGGVVVMLIGKKKSSD